MAAQHEYRAGCMQYPTLPAEYYRETLRKQLCSLMDEEKLQDTTIILSETEMKVSAFLLSLVSPVLHAMVNGNFKESISRKLNFKDVSEKMFAKLLLLACGDGGQVAGSTEELFELGELAERLQMTAVVSVVEDMLPTHVNTETCAEVLGRSDAIGLQQVTSKCLFMLQDHFDEISRTQGFLEMDEEALSILLEEDELGVRREEEVLEAVRRWISGNPFSSQGERLLTKVRFGVIDDEYLKRVVSTTPSHNLLVELVGEALNKKNIEHDGKEWDGAERLCKRWAVSRKMPMPVLHIAAGTVLGRRQFGAPQFVALDPDGGMLVTDAGLEQVLIFGSDGARAAQLGSRGMPNGVAVDGGGRVVVADAGNHRIQVFNADRTVALCFGTAGGEAGQLKGPRGVAVDNEGRIVVADYGNHRIQVFNPDGSVARCFGSKGDAVGQLKRPWGVAVDRAGRVVVCDHGNHRVQVFEEDGSVALCFGGKGDAPGRLKRPMGVDVDRQGRIVVADSGNNRVQVFRPDGSVACAVEASAGGLVEPCSVAVDRAGRIVVVDYPDPAAPRLQVL